MIGVIYSAIMPGDPILIHRTKLLRVSTSLDKLCVFCARIVMANQYWMLMPTVEQVFRRMHVMGNVVLICVNWE
jgi:hypothetical protein